MYTKLKSKASSFKKFFQEVLKPISFRIYLRHSCRIIGSFRDYCLAVYFGLYSIIRER